MIKKILWTYLFFITPCLSYAGEGMWIPLLLEKYNIEDMQDAGLKLSAEDIYSINRASLKDAVVIFGGGCTGEVISNEGLVLTNHHCGFYQINKHSSPENDYVTHGFYASGKENELVNPGLTVTFLIRIKDVTAQVLNGISADFTERQRDALVWSNKREIVASVEDTSHYTATIKDFYYGNAYYLFVYEEFKDIRLVAAPPEAIGNFGGDTDNWMWPRHTGDFSLFRIYADKNNRPAAYSPDNRPYKPRKHLEISLDGVEKEDFTMLLGYPGSTQQYLYSAGVAYIKNKSLPNKIALRTKRIETMAREMEKDTRVRIQYASKYKRTTNSWKKWKGMIRGLESLNAVEKKKEFESRFVHWTSSHDTLKTSYGGLFANFDEVYSRWLPYYFALEYISEGIFTIEIFNLVADYMKLVNELDRTENEVSGLVESIENLKSRTKSFHQKYLPAIDRENLSYSLKQYKDSVHYAFHPEIMEEIDRKYDGNVKNYVEKAFEKSVFLNQDELLDLLGKFSFKGVKKMAKDPLFRLYNQFGMVYTTLVRPGFRAEHAKLDSLYRKYVEGILLYENAQAHYPDANFTMRLTYGNAQGYALLDAVDYQYFTTLSGALEKEDTADAAFVVPEKLKKLYDNKDFGRYGMGDSVMPVCFTASNHTSGGNSGSPVLNADGQLIGINFDRNWEGTMSDIIYDPAMCRNIAVDIRYVLFILEKYLEAGDIISELTIN